MVSNQSWLYHYKGVIHTKLKLTVEKNYNENGIINFQNHRLTSNKGSLANPESNFVQMLFLSFPTMFEKSIFFKCRKKLINLYNLYRICPCTFLLLYILGLLSLYSTTKVLSKIKYLKLQKYSIALVGEVKSDICLFFYIQIYAK